MKRRELSISAKRNPDVKLAVIPGHFATSNTHVNLYIDMFDIKHQYKIARETAKLVAYDFQNKPIDTIVCFEGTQIIAAFATEFLVKNYQNAINFGTNPTIVIPEKINYNQFILRDDAKESVWGKNVLIMVAKVTTGSVLHRLAECVKYYGGNIVGISALFSAVENLDNMPVHAIFTGDDLPNYSYFPIEECPDCANNKRIEAIVSEHGYSKL